MTLPAPTLPPPTSPLHRRGGHPVPGPGCGEEVPGPPKVEWSPGPEDASSAGPANAMEAVTYGGGELLEGAGCGNGGGLGAGTSSPQGPAGRGRIANPLDARGGAGLGGFALGTSWAWAHVGGRCRAGAWGWCHSRGGHGQ